MTIPPDIEARLDSANEALRHARRLHAAFLAFLAYVALIIWGVTDRDLLLGSPVRLPLLQIELSQYGVFLVAPALVWLLHAHRLVALLLLGPRLGGLAETPGGGISNRLTPSLFTAAYLGEAPTSALRRAVAGFFWAVESAVPLGVLLLIQWRFAPVHAFWMKAYHMAVLALDAAMVMFVIWSPELRRTVTQAAGRISAASPDFRFACLIASAPAMLALLLSMFLAAVIPPIPLLPPDRGDVDPLWRRAVNGVTGALNRTLLAPGLDVSGQTLSGEELTFDQLAKLFHEAGQPKEPEEPEEGSETAEPDEVRIAYDFAKELDLSGRDLRYANFAGSRLLKVRFTERSRGRRGAEPRAANLKGVNLLNAELPDARMRRVDLRHAMLFRAKLDRADLRDARLEGANLVIARLHGADLRGARLQDANLFFTELQGANLQGISLQEVTLRTAVMQSTDLKEARLQGLDLRESRMEAADLRGTYLQGAVLDATRLEAADLRGARLQGTSLIGARLSGAELRGAQLQGADLRRAELLGADLTEANLQGADLRGARLYGSVFTGANLEHARLTELELGWPEEISRESYLESLEELGVPDREPRLALEERIALARARVEDDSWRFEPGERPENVWYDASVTAWGPPPEGDEAVRAYADGLVAHLMRIAAADPAVAHSIVGRVAIVAIARLDPDTPRLDLGVAAYGAALPFLARALRDAHPSAYPTITEAMEKLQRFDRPNLEALAERADGPPETAKEEPMPAFEPDFPPGREPVFLEDETEFGDEAPSPWETGPTEFPFGWDEE
jgi:uncharacterized protein YjbI with pentapeptide repeats